MVLEPELRKSVLKNAKIAIISKGNNYKTLKVKQGDYIVIQNENIKAGYSFGFKISNPKEKGLIENSNFIYLNELERKNLLS